MRQQKLDETAAVVGSTAKNSELPTVENLNKVRDIDGDLSLQQSSLHNIDVDGVPVGDGIGHCLELYSSAADDNYNYTKSSSKRAASDTPPCLVNNNQPTRTILPPLDSTSDISGLLSLKAREDSESEYLDMERYIDSENNTYHGERFARPTEGFFSQNLGQSRRERYGTQTSLRETWKKVTEPILTLQLQQQQLATVVPSSVKQQLSPMTSSSISDLMTSSYVTSMMTSTNDGSSSLISTDDNLWETGDAAFTSLGGERDSMGASVYAASSVSAFSDSDFCDVTNPENYIEQSNAAINSHFSNVNKIGSVPMECSYSEEFTRNECFDRNDVTPTSFLRYDQNDVTPSGSDDDFAQRSGSMAHYNDVVWKSNRKKVLARKRVHGNDSENNNSKEYVSYREARGSSDNSEKVRSVYVKPASIKKKESATEFRLDPVNSSVQRSMKPSRLKERTSPSLTYEKGSFKDDLKRNNYVDMWRMNSASPDATRYDPQFHRDGVSVVKKQTASFLKRNDASLTDSGLFEDQQQETEGLGSIDDTKRSLARISSGLARNVTVLRERKQLMSDVFGPSLAEERIRVRELKRFQREALEARKRVLLETLADLKHSLSAQAQRLQGAYDTVLSRQYAMMKSSQISGR